MSQVLRLALTKRSKRCQASQEAMEPWWKMARTSFPPRRHAVLSVMERMICGLRRYCALVPAA
jgi:hypothetical protein